MSIQKEFVLRYRDEGHVRFQIPAQICSVAIAKTVSDGITEIKGVTRVNLYCSQQKLAIRFDESVCDFKSLARQLFLLLAELESNGSLKPKPVSKRTLWKQKAKSKVDSFKVTRWIKQRMDDAKETVQAAKVVSKLGMKDPEKTIIEFLNDILVLYLIRLHWNDITQRWLLKPLTYRYEWMALFYMFFLFIRSRRPK